MVKITKWRCECFVFFFLLEKLWVHLGLTAVGHAGVGPQPPSHMGMVSVQIGWIKAALCWSLLNIGGEGATAALWKREQLRARRALRVDFRVGSVSNSVIPAIWKSFIYCHWFYPIFFIVEMGYFLICLCATTYIPLFKILLNFVPGGCLLPFLRTMAEF